MKVSEHLSKFHQMASSHHREMAKCHGEAMGKAAAGDPAHNFHKSAKATHEDAAAQHDEMDAECQKAVVAADLEKSHQTIPTRVSMVTPDLPSNIRAVPRYGAPVVNRPSVPIEFQDLVRIEE